MEESGNNLTYVEYRRAEAIDSLEKMQNTINQLTIQLAVLAARLAAPVAGDNLDDFQAEQKPGSSIINLSLVFVSLLKYSTFQLKNHFTSSTHCSACSIIVIVLVHSCLFLFFFQ
jgi:hypothetical protein